MVFRFSPTEHDDANTIKNDDGGGVGGYDLILRNSHISKNISLLISLGAGDVIVDICCSPKALPGDLSNVLAHFHISKLRASSELLRSL